MKATDYPMLVVWSEADQAYLARVFDLPGCAADGATAEQAVANAQVVIREWLETAQELKRDIPKPSDDAAMERYLVESIEEQRKEFEEAVQSTAREMVDQLLPRLIQQYVEQQKTERRHVFYSYPARRIFEHA
jgi:predicted RNase H-like HicB family nuclease